MEKDIVGYIQDARHHGLSDLEIKQNLLDAGWEAGVVEESFAHVKALESKPHANADEDFKLPKIAPEAQPVTQHETIPAPENPAPRPLQPVVTMSEHQFTAKPGRSWMRKAVLAGLVVLLLAAAGYFYYTYALGSPTKVWTQFTQTEASKIYENKFTWSYQDNGSLDKSDASSIGLDLKDMKLSFDGNFYIDASEAENPQSSSDLQYTFSSGNTSFSTGLKYRLINKSFYFNIGENPLLNNIFNILSEGKRYDWIKIDLEELQRQTGTYASTSPSSSPQSLFSDEFNNELKQMWEDANFIKVDKYVGREKINDISTVHFRNSLDKQALKTLTAQMLDKIAARAREMGETVDDGEIQTAKVVFEEIVNKVEIKEFETWIGTKDFRLYRVHFVSNAPSFISLVKTANADNTLILGSARAKSRDAKRLADMRQMASALELYYNDKNGYPASADGKPQELTPFYIGILPTAPAPSDGACTDYYNTYWYEQKEKGRSYELTFCLGEATGGYAAGIARLTPRGIEANVPCPSSAENCTLGNTGLEAPDQAQQVKDFINKLDFNGEMRIDANYFNFGQKWELSKPEEYFDLFQALKDKGLSQGAGTGGQPAANPLTNPLLQLLGQ